MKRRRSAQRDRLYSLIKESKRHPTAKWLLEQMSTYFPSINEGNLYRNIRILIDEGHIVARTFDDNTEHYDAITTNHYHFVCSRCGKIIDIDIDVTQCVPKEIQQRLPHRIDTHTIQFFGVCEDCLQHEKQSSDTYDNPWREKKDEKEKINEY